MEIKGLEHVQLAMPADGEELARLFYQGTLGIRGGRSPFTLPSVAGAGLIMASSKAISGREGFPSRPGNRILRGN